MHDRPSAPRPPLGIFWNPYLQIFLTVLLTAAAQILLKVGADDSAAEQFSFWSWLGLSGACLGLDLAWHRGLLASFGGWLYALRFLPLGLAFALTNGSPYFRAARLLAFSGRTHQPLRGSGILIIIAGILLLAQSVAKVEEKAMSLVAWLLVFISQLALVAGQIFLKHGMSRREQGAEKSRGWIGQLRLALAP